MSSYMLKGADEFERLVRLSRDIISIMGIVVAGFWSYYLFVKGRTFELRAKLQIKLQELYTTHSTAIIRFNIINIGRTKLSSIEGQACYFAGEVASDFVAFVPVHFDNDVLKTYREPGQSLILEPGDEINVDTPILIKDFANALLLIKSVLEVDEQRIYKENAICCLDK